MVVAALAHVAVAGPSRAPACPLTGDRLAVLYVALDDRSMVPTTFPIIWDKPTPRELVAEFAPTWAEGFPSKASIVVLYELVRGKDRQIGSVSRRRLPAKFEAAAHRITVQESPSRTCELVVALELPSTGTVVWLIGIDEKHPTSIEIYSRVAFSSIPDSTNVSSQVVGFLPLALEVPPQEWDTSWATNVESPSE